MRFTLCSVLCAASLAVLSPRGVAAEGGVAPIVIPALQILPGDPCERCVMGVCNCLVQITLIY